MMPRDGAAARSEQLGTIARLAHEKFDRARDRRAARRGGAVGGVAGLRLRRGEPRPRRCAATTRSSRRVPPELTAEMSRAGAIAEPVWREARQASDWSIVPAAPRDAIALKRRYVECFEPADEDYDILLDDYEPGMKTAEVRAVFDELKVGLVPLIAEIADNADAVDDSCMTGRLPDRRAEDGRATRSSPTSASPPTRGASTRPSTRSPHVQAPTTSG